jgi:hypothetical protein
MPTPTNEPNANQASDAAATGAEPAARSLDPWAVAVDDATASMREWAGALKTSFATAVAGGYTAKSLTGDVAAMAARGARDWARLVVNTAGIARAVATTPIATAAPTTAAPTTTASTSAETTSAEPATATPDAPPSTGSEA